jgi:hypothetical protein
MSRLMSVALTERAVREQTKTVTRRKGWQFLRPGDRITLCRKVMGRRNGEPLVRIAEVVVDRVSRERLCEIPADDVAREGFPQWTPAQFVAFFMDHMGGDAKQVVTRIEWAYLSDPAAASRG